MRHVRLSTAALVFTLILLVPTPSSAKGLDSFLGQINVSAQADLGRFRADLSATFGVSSGKVDGLFEICDSPADVYMTLRIGEVARVHIDRVVEQYRTSKGQGWGVIAKNLGIQPGSAEFHALKQERLGSRGHAAASPESGSRSGNGRSKARK